MTDAFRNSKRYINNASFKNSGEQEQPSRNASPGLWLDDGDVRLYHGDALQVLGELPDSSVDCVVTSPPYWGLRDYGNEGQLGLEPTPDLFVTNMVNVFREIRRVLADHGTCWVNLGDSYAHGNTTRVADEWERTNERDKNKPYTDSKGNVTEGSAWSPQSAKRRDRATTGVPPGLKEKDLVGIPWRVAFAIQQPYYAGRIKDVNDRFWLAAMVDAEGCIHVHRRKAGASAHSTFEKADGTVSEYVRKQDTYGVMVSIDNTNKAIIDRCQAIIGQGSRYTQEAGTGKQQRKQAIHRLTLTGNQSRELLRELYPYLVAKQREARIAYHSPSNGPEAEAAHEAIKALHNGLDTTIDRPAPPSLLEPGWYLRSDVIWGKPNPMPESVTDRPTKAHEYVFLLTKRPRYWFDAEAVREPQTSVNNHFRSGRNIDGDPNNSTPKQGIEGNGHPNPAGRNVRSVWQIATQPYPEAHFATFPEELARRCILAGCPTRVCRVCGKPSERIVDVEPLEEKERHPYPSSVVRNGPELGFSGGVPRSAHHTVGWSDCGHNNWRVGVTLDPFICSGTVAKVARDHQRHAIGIDLNVTYLELAARRLQQLSLLNL